MTTALCVRSFTPPVVFGSSRLFGWVNRCINAILSQSLPEYFFGTDDPTISKFSSGDIKGLINTQWCIWISVD